MYCWVGKGWYYYQALKSYFQNCLLHIYSHPYLPAVISSQNITAGNPITFGYIAAPPMF